MESLLLCTNCGKEAAHHKKDSGPWFYKVCSNCGKETLLEGVVWEEFSRNRIDDNRRKAGLE